MYAVIRSCRYCANNKSCGIRYKLKETFKALSLEATAVVNCKNVKPYYNVGDIVPFAAWPGTEKTDETKEILQGELVGYLFDRYGNARHYAIKIKRCYSRYFQGDGDEKYWSDGENASTQFPKAEIKPDEILVFIRYNLIEFPF